jgi:D-alanyl-D-alanine dipeptidase
MILLSDPRVAAVEVRENDEVLVDLRASGLRIDPRYADDAGAFAFVRRGVQDRLHRAQAALPVGVYLLIVEGWRSLATQHRLFDAYETTVRAASPELDDSEVRSATSAYIAPPELAPHTTGGAVDVTLCDADGVELDMGTSLNATPLESGNLCYTDAADLDPLARRNRGLLVFTMTRAGLVNYPTEWWHWSYGDRYWALSVGEPHAIYGAVTVQPGS